jgi:ubiquinone/menaquinone biosynthesis C-methylase UbiE
MPSDIPEPIHDPFTRIAPYYDKLMVSVPYRFWVSYLEAVWKTHGCKPTRVLDIACGTGTVALLLANKGMEIVGVDISPAMVEQAKAKALRETANVECFAQDASQMTPIDPPADTAICLFDSLNNILELSKFEDALRNIKRSLTDGGLLIFDLNTAYAFRQGMFNQRSSKMDKPLSYVWRSKYDEPSHLCTVTMNFEIDEPDQALQRFTEVHTQRAYTRGEVEESLRSAGFTEITSYDAYTLFPPKKRSDRIFWVAK